MSNGLDGNDVELFRKTIELIQKNTNEELNGNVVKVSPAVVEDYNKETQKATVRFLDDGENTKSINGIINSTPYMLNKGDNVKVCYTKNKAKGWIAAKLGASPLPLSERYVETSVFHERATIQLFDAVTGEKVLEQTSSGIVTNAISNVLNCPFEYSHGYDNFLPVQTSSLAGILLWDDKIPKDKNIIFPTKRVAEVGHAGATYSGDDNRRGSYSKTESGVITNGYRHVWNFAADKVNGEIKCLTLTSIGGGNIGANSQWSDGSNQFFETSSEIFQVGETTVCACLSKDIYVSFNYTEGCFYYFNYLNNGKVGLSSTYLLRKINPTNIKDTNKYIPKLKNYNYSINDSRLFVDKGIAYIATKLSDTENKISVAKINLKTKSIISEQVITLQFPSEYKTTQIRFDVVGADENRIYAFSVIQNYSTEINLCEFTYNGNFVRNEIRNTGDTGVTVYTNGSSLFKFGNEIYYLVNYHYLCKLNSNIVMKMPAFSSHIDMYNASSMYPLYVYAVNNRFMVLGMFLPYLGSINNLSKPVVKTNQHTMKIIYEITEE